LVNGIMLATPP